eukprot:SAG22_NODE_29_length_28404_cov_23.294153_19_plen_725_part_00
MPKRRQQRAQQDDGDDGMPSDDEIQIFHRDRTEKMIGAEGGGGGSDDESSESEVDEVLAMTSTQTSSDEDEDEDGGGRGGNGDDDDDSDADGDEDDEAKKTGTKGWGKKRSAFYDGADYEDASGDSDDAEYDALEAEEEEAKRLQQSRAKLLQSSDFGEDEDDATMIMPKKKASGSSSSKKKGGRKGRGAAAGEDDAETLSKDLSLLNDAEKLQLLTNDAPELLELLNSFTSSLTEIRRQIQPLVQQVKDGKLPTSKGSSFLEVKFHLLLSYCINVVFYMLLKAKGESVRDHPVIETLVKLRVLIEKCRPIDKKLKYQLDKLLAAAANPGGAAARGALAHKPRPQQLVGDDDEEEEEEEKGEGDAGAAASAKLYQVPKFSAAGYDASGAGAKELRKAQAKRGRALKSDLIKSMQEEFGEAPREIKGYDDSGLRGKAQEATKEAAERERYEEDNFIRLTLSKKDKAKEKLRQKAANGLMTDEFDTAQFSSLAGLAADDGGAAQRSRAQAGEDKKRRALAKYLNDIEQKQKSAARKNRGGSSKSADSDASFEPQAKKRRKPSYDVAAEDDGTDLPHSDNFGGGGDSGSGSGGGGGGGNDSGSDDDFYKVTAAEQNAKKAAKKARKAAGAKELDAARDDAFRSDRADPDSKRAASSAIIKNRGLTPHRKKIDRNPRVKKKVKYAAKVKKGRASGISGTRVDTSVGGASHYSGEGTGINTKISRSQRF